MTIRWDKHKAKEYIESLGFKYDENNNDKVSSHTKLVMIQNNYFYYTSINILQAGKLPEAFAKSNVYTIQNINVWCKLNNKPFELISKFYNGSHEQLQWKCLKKGCGEIFEMPWHSIYSGSECHYCCAHNKKVCLSNCLATLNPKLSKEWHPTKNGSLTPYNVTHGSNKKVWWKCENGHEWESTIGNRVKKETICPFCFGKIPTNENNLLVVNPKLCKEWNYNKNKKKPEDYLPNSNKKVWWKCRDCEYQWESSILNRTYGNGCPECNKSKGEKRITKYFVLKDIYYIPQKEFDGLIGLGNGLLSYDFYLPQYNLLIEYDGEFHYIPIKLYKNEPIKYAEERLQKQQIHDQLKTQYALNYNINLLRIPYWEFDNIEQILERELIL